MTGPDFIPGPHLVAHRGWTRHHRENSLAALTDAVNARCAAVEFDVRRTEDDQWVVYHDATLERLDGVSLAVEEHPLRVLRVHADLPHLEEALAIFGPSCMPMIEVKSPRVDGVDALVRIVKSVAGRFPIVLIARGSVMPGTLVERLPDVAVYLYQRDWDAAEHAPEGIAGYDLWSGGIDPGEAEERIARFHARGREVAVWTVNDPDECRAWGLAGADRIITDVPWALP